MSPETEAAIKNVTGKTLSGIRVGRRLLLIASLAYLYIPLFIFFAGWTRIWISLPTVLIMLILLKRMVRGMMEGEDETAFVISLPVLIFLVAGVVFFGLVSGWGGYMPQIWDYDKHNAVIMDLVNKPWPVYYKNAATPSMLTYYIGQYLVPSLFGKMADSFRCAEVFFLVWNALGLFLVILNLYVILRCDRAWKQILSLFGVVLFNGGLIISQHIYFILTREEIHDLQWMILSDDVKLQLRSNFVDLRWVSPQCIGIWVIVTLLWYNRERLQYLIPLLMPGMLSAILPFAGLCLIVLISLIIRVITQKDMVRAVVGRLFSFDNFLAVLTPGLPLVIYYMGNILAEKDKAVGFCIQKPGIWLYLSFLIGEIGIYAIFAFRENRGDTLFIGTLIFFLILPFGRMGYYNDLVMSGSIPAMFMIMICVLKTIMENPACMRAGVLSAILAVSALYPLEEMSRVLDEYVPGEIQHWVDSGTLERYSDPVNGDLSWRYNYFTYDPENDIFVKYMARIPF